VVYSLYNDEFKKTLNPEIKTKVLLDGMVPDDVSLLEKPDYVNLSKLAVNYSDAIIQGTEKIHPDLEKYVPETGKPFLSYQPKETYIDAYDEFYEKVW
jgi:starch synthase